jgi:hypothetical protein
MTKTTIHFDTTPFVRSHGRQPKGRGGWAFSFGREAPQVPAFFSPGMTYAEAKKWAAEYARGFKMIEGVADVWLDVLP